MKQVVNKKKMRCRREEFLSCLLVLALFQNRRPGEIEGILYY